MRPLLLRYRICQTKIPINFEGKYKWIVFLPSKMHPNIGVLNRYYGVMESGKVKVRGIEVRRRDTPKFIFDAQTDIIKELSVANNVSELYERIHKAMDVRAYRQKPLDDIIPVWHLIITMHLSKQPEHYRQQVSQANKLSEYYHGEWHCLTHFKYKRFIRGNKNCYLTFITKDFLDEIAHSKPITYDTIKIRIQRANKPIQLYQFRDRFGTQLINNVS